ncbi:serine hydrolase domain-containing protein [Nocardia sp. NPDC051570]|uniref:serine hydrolase domain-containing protein n=1 Tax=Nocardia sp. NPDC051570 TaxID=3364324 RepID=UPI003787442F
MLSRFGRRALLRPAIALPLLPLILAGADPAAREEDLPAALERFREQGRLPGLAAAVWRGPEPVAAAAVGVRKHGDPTAVTVEDRWHLGSDTKAMTATLVGAAAERALLRFEDRLGELFAGEPIHPQYAGVTLEQLLHHRGGTPENPPDDLWAIMAAGGDPAAIRATVARGILSRPPAQAPGQFAYSNAGYLIVGAILERRFAMPWETLMRTALFTPLRMISAGFGAPGDPSTVDQPWGHTGGLEPMPPGDPGSDNPPALGPAGTVHCTLADWGLFLGQHLAGARGEPTMVSAATMSRLHQPPPGGDYAAGWLVAERDWAGGPVLTHTGSNALWTAEAWLAPADNLMFAVVANRGDDQALSTVADVSGWLAETYGRR